ncbi:MAG: aminopeptidase, partial [Candidatus Falkowbacteria bacterium]|nr:aminopeptidase [Candidatus Falkowbacteria bacterium]
ETQIEIEKNFERLEVAKNALIESVGLDKSKKILIIRDETSNPISADILKSAAKELGAEIEEIFLDKKTTRKKVQKFLSPSMAVINLTDGYHPALDQIFDDDLDEYQFRLLHLADLGPEAMDKNGAISENIEEMEMRMNKMENELNKAEGFRITSTYGTNLEIKLRMAKERAWAKESGRLQDGKWGNLPAGEIFTTPDEYKINGVLVLPILDSDISDYQGVDEFVRVNIKDGAITSIEGGESARIMRKKLQKDMQVELDDKKILFMFYELPNWLLVQTVKLVAKPLI